MLKKIKKEEDRCLNETERTIIEWLKKSPVAGVIVEPIQAEGGDKHATPYFFNKLQDICEKHGIAFIVDEVQTGLGCGKIWQHENWNLKKSPDFVTFSKKLQQAGFFSKPEFRAPQTYINFNTWLGDPIRVMQVETIVNTIEKDNLIKQNELVGIQLLNGLKLLAKKYPKIKNERGVGTFCAIDCESTEFRDKLIGELRNNGVESGGSGKLTIRFRPSLVFASKHCNILLNIFENTLKKLN